MIRPGSTVRPTNIGTDHNGAAIDHSHLRGTVLDVWQSPGSAGEPVAAIRWTRGTYFGHSRTDGFPVAMLASVSPTKAEENPPLNPVRIGPGYPPT